MQVQVHVQGCNVREIMYRQRTSAAKDRAYPF
jgi:hypothetical protein